MAIIKPTKQFSGSDISNKLSFKYTKPDIRQVAFNQKENKEGVYLYFLPPYKQDADGNGVWYKPFKIRDNFGDKYKEKYAVAPGVDPAGHFEKNFKIHFPEEAMIIDEVDDRGQKRKRYPNYGRTTTRVIYNVAYVDRLDAGVHVLDLPSFMGASQINDWLNEKDARGRERPLLNDPDRCIPVFVKLKEGGSGNPWLIQPDQNSPAQLGDELIDSDHLYNLDTDVLDYKSEDEIISKLREMFSTEVFDRCMEGYRGSGNVIISASPTALKSTSIAKLDRAPAGVSKDVPALRKVAVQDEDEIPMEYVDEAPVLKSATVSREEVTNFLKRKPASK